MANSHHVQTSQKKITAFFFFLAAAFAAQSTLSGIISHFEKENKFPLFYLSVAGAILNGLLTLAYLSLASISMASHPAKRVLQENKPIKAAHSLTTFFNGISAVSALAVCWYAKSAQMNQRSTTLDLLISHTAVGFLSLIFGGICRYLHKLHAEKNDEKNPLLAYRISVEPGSP